MSRPAITPVILCGGAGTRLWPLSRQARPKQMLKLAGERTMLEATVARVRDSDLFGPACFVAAANQKEALVAIAGEDDRILLETCPRNTAMAIALAAFNAPEAMLLVLPSDHLIADPAGLEAAVRRALPAADDGWIVTFGMKPESAETGFGYVERGEPIGEGVFAARRFVEKPCQAEAERFVAGGQHDWNGGIFLMRADVLIAGLRQHAPDIAEAAERAVATQRADGRIAEPDGAATQDAPARSIDHALMEHFDRVAVVPVAIGWSDVGSWAAAHAAAPQDEAGNAVSGDVLLLDASGCLVRSEGPLVAAVGVSDLVIIATADAVLVVPLDQSQRVREIVARLGPAGLERLK